MSSTMWVLEGYFGDGQSIQRITLSQLPALVGRDPNNPIAILRSEVSRNHAQFYEMGGQMMLKDLGSTNGTFVNHQRLTDSPISLRHGDVIHFASYEARLIEESSKSSVRDNTASMTVMNVMPMGNKMPVGVRQLDMLLAARAIAAQYQPIVDMNGDLFAYELLGRGSRNDLPSRPMELFRIAESVTHKAAELSTLMRDCGIEQAVQKTAGQTPCLFMNTHPEELKHLPELVKSLEEARRLYPTQRFVLEIHEDAVTDVKVLRQLSDNLERLNIQLAFDDFGAGQARLMEMVDVPVAYVKFDIALIRGLPSAPPSKQKMVAALAKMTKDMGISPLAEGVEDQDEFNLCKQMGFDLIQGYYFGKPADDLNYSNPLR